MTERGDIDDPYLWLEDLHSAEAMEWVGKYNERAVDTLANGHRFAELRDGIRAVLDSPDRIPATTWRGEHLYNLWQDERNPRGLWRRTTIEEFRQAEPDWEILLDIDALAVTEAESWVWQGATALRPSNDRYLVSLSRGGSDARVVREFDLPSRSFVPDGFTVPEAKTYISWIDLDHVLVGTDFGPGSLTASGYPRVVKRWRRGTPLAEADVIFEGEPDDVLAFGEHDQTTGYDRDFIVRRIGFFTSRFYIRRSDGALVLVDVPEDAVVAVHRDWLTIRLRTSWTVGDVTYAAGALLATDLEEYLAGGRDLTALFEPDERSALSDYTWTRDHLIVTTLSDVRSRLAVHTPSTRDGWSSHPIDGLPEFAQATVADTNEHDSNELMVSTSGFLEPATLWYGVAGHTLEPVKHQPAMFDATGLQVRQFFAASADGTRVPYFVIGDAATASAPTLLFGYGGFEVPMTPAYSGSDGLGWLTRGGTLVMANIRGGGEYGPRWHHAALRENRPRAYEDFAAVAQDLVARGITTPSRLGIEGGSNGGLLMGVMLTRYPHLFGAVAGMVPLLDMRRYHRLLAGASWMAEYGDPDAPEDWAFLQRYSPYHNIPERRTLPPVLFITSTRDDRVHAGHARKMVARLEELGHDVTYYENIEGGHAAAADNGQRAFRSALVFEFLWRTLG
jgi:prolyl oligopeptidase